MRTLKFKSIWLLSENEQRARSEAFSPKKTLLVGMNHTGKSSLIKSIFIALGAFPTGDLDRWSPDTATLVEFSIDDAIYYVIQQGSYRALFDNTGDFCFASTNATHWGNNLCQIIGFNLVLTDQQSNSVNGDARTFFLPFYINQDGSWLAQWSTFSNLQQYKRPIESVLDYFTGVKPPAYYELNSKKLVIQKELSELRAEERVIRNIKDRFGQTVPLYGPKTVPDIFEQDIRRLSDEVTSLNKDQELLRNNIVREQEAVESLSLQAKMADHALSLYDKDVAYLHSEPHEALVCPVCHAEHDKSFIDILRYAEDGRVLRNIAVQLRSDRDKANANLRASRSSLKQLDIRYFQISSILETRRGDMQLNDVIRSMGAEAAFAAFDNELLDLENKMSPLAIEIDSINDKLEELTSAKRSRAILTYFRRHYSAALLALNMPEVDTSKLKLNSRPKISGSGGPRSILAYYAALWQTTRSEHGSFLMPVVIDSPQQQGQDAANLPIMIEYISKKLPDDMQVILALETDTSLPFDKVIKLDKSYHLLSQDQYLKVQAFVRPFIDTMYKMLLGSSANEDDSEHV